MDRKHWNKMVSENAPSFGAFLQSWEWGEFQRQLGRKVVRVDHVSQEGRTIAQAIQMPLPFGQFYWYIPKGPNGNAPIEFQTDVLRSELPGAIFMRLEPADAGSMLQVKDVQPSTTMMLNLERGEDELLAGMKSKTRYNIRLSERKGVISKVVGLDRFEDFIRLMEQTAKRDQFLAWPHAYYRTLLETLEGGEARAFIAMAFYEDRPLVGNIIVDFQDTRTYLYGASSNLHRNVMAPYHLHWFLIQDAVKKGFKTFDFWGVAPEDASDDHRLKGVTRYKAGFGGDVVSMPGTFDLPTKHMWYSFYKLGKRIRRMKTE